MKQKRKDLTKWMSLPALLLYGLFFVYPLLKGIGMSMTDWDGMGEAKFVGLANFARFFQDARAMGDIRTTLLFAAGSALLLNLVGLGYAFLMGKAFSMPQSGTGRHLSACHHQPADYGIYLVFFASARQRVSVLCCPAAGRGVLSGKMDEQLSRHDGGAHLCECMAICGNDYDHLSGGAQKYFRRYPGGRRNGRSQCVAALYPRNASPFDAFHSYQRGNEYYRIFIRF